MRETCKMNKSDTLVVNLLGGPGAGKSSVRAGVFKSLKFRGVDCEEAHEYMKELVWEERAKTFKDQIYLFAKQHHRIFNLLGKVQAVITDSPIIFTPIYSNPEINNGSSFLSALALNEFKKMNNLNIFVRRKKPFNPNGRNQTLSEAVEIDGKIKALLYNEHHDFKEVDGTEEGCDEAVRIILERLNFNNQSNDLKEIDSSLSCVPDRNITAPEFEWATEGYDLSKLPKDNDHH